MSTEVQIDVESYDYLIACIITRTICGIYMIYLIIIEIMELKHSSSFKKYISNDVWDLLLFAVYIAYIPISFIYEKDEYVVKVF